MVEPFHDSVQLQESLELDYFRRPRGPRHWRRVLTIVAGLASAVVAAVSLLPGQRHMHQAAPVATGHAMLNDRCDSCHSSAFQPVARLLSCDPSRLSVGDAACRRCHSVGPHNDKVAETSCALCHQEHRGKAKLARVADAQCTRCHADLKHSFPDAGLAKVTSFAHSHPEFAVWRNRQGDPGNIAFNHKAHMTLAHSGRGEADKALTRLFREGCAYCHKPDAGGHYMAPVTFQQHCQECHPLVVRLTVPLPGDIQRIPHPGPGEGPADVQDHVRQRVLALVQEYPEIMLKRVRSPHRPFPGAEPVAKEIGTSTEEHLAAAERQLFAGPDGCRRCHPDLKAGVGAGMLPELPKPFLPRRWLEKSIFNHQSHRSMECTDCHGQALASKQTSDVLLPKLEDCRKCHEPKIGARSDCAECHVFHRR
ncbi:MAG: cytochrome c3 family protein [Planctomycetes bacterium]|nr:cytochrome c3 family protein [Planctomycetota bacterium]